MKVIHLYPQCPAEITFWSFPEADDPAADRMECHPMILEFDNLDQLAETLWALITRAALHGAGRDRGLDFLVNHNTWLAMPDEGKEAAREIAREIAGIFEVRQ